MSIANRANLISAISQWLVRTDMADDIPIFIANAEARLKRDYRVRRIRDTAFTIANPSEDLPVGFKEIVALGWDDTSGAPEPRNSTLHEVNWERRRKTEGGKPTVYAIVGDRIHFGPEPGASYDFSLTYWENLHPQLSPVVLSNWLLDDHPDIYLYSSLVEAAPYLKDDARLETWHTLRETALEELHRANEYARFGGNLSRPAPSPIG